MKLLLVGLYVVALAAGAAAIVARSHESMEYTAAKRLEKGHQIQDADLRAPDRRWALASGLPSRSSYAGRFLDRPVERTEPVKRAYLVDRPPVSGAAGTVAYAWYLRDTDREWSRVLDVGWLVDLCAETCPVMGAPVLAVDCRSPGGTDCVAILQFTPDQLKTMLAYPVKQKLRIAVSAARAGG